MAAFDIFSANGLRLADRFARVFNLRYIARDPLSGVVDGTNKVFYSTYSPILSSGSVEVRLGDTLVSSGSYSVNYEPGAYLFNFAPSIQPVSTYTIAAYPDRVIRNILVAGFDEMELWWYRGLYLSEVQGTGQITLAHQDSTSAFIVNSSGSDPPIGDRFFSNSQAQLALYGRFVQLVFYRTLMGEHALSDFIWQEAQGLRVDKSMTVRNLQIVKDEIEKMLEKALEQAQVEFTGTAIYGGFIAPLHTREYLAHRFWERASKDEDWKGSTPYRGLSY